MRIIDPHVHCRDEEQAYKTTIAKRLKTAKKSGVVAIFDMPNTQRPVTTEARILERFALADAANSSVFYSTYIGATADPSQVRGAVRIHKKYFPRVIGIKYFAGRSVGDLAVMKKIDQRIVFGALNEYRGLLAIHCEEGSLMKPELWDPRNPISHCWARPPEAELKSIIQQVELAYDTGFQGTLHIAHITTPEAVDYVNSVRNQMHGNQMGNFKITCAATPHHLFMYDKIMNEENGIMLKVNPPLRTRKQQQGLFKRLYEGKIDWMESDDAKHTDDEKTGKVNDKNGDPIYMSGISDPQVWQRTIATLRQANFSEQQIQDLTFNNAVKAFNLKENFYLQNG